MLDTLRRIETPEGAELTLRTAGIQPRLWAWTLDTLIRAVALFGIGVVAEVFGFAGLGLFLIAWFLLEWAYPVLFEVYSGGATPGKKSLGLAVVHGDGTPVSFASSAVRNLLRAIDFFPFCYAAGFVTALLDPDGRRLGDIAAGTLVVYVDRPPGISRIPEGDPYPTWVTLTPEEQKAVVEFAERLGDWTDARAAELADIVQPLTDATGREGVERLLGVARSIQEGR